MSETVHVVSEEIRKEFSEKLESADYVALEHTVTFKAVEFVPYKEFRNKKIKADDYKSERDKYITKHSTNLHNEIHNFKSVLSEKGLFVTNCQQSAKSYNPILGFLEQIQALSPEKAVETFKDLLNEYYSDEE